MKQMFKGSRDAGHWWRVWRDPLLCILTGLALLILVMV